MDSRARLPPGEPRTFGRRAVTEPGLLWGRWNEVDALLERALDLPAREREAMVREAVPEAGPFRDLVLRMVRELDDDEPRLAAPAAAIVAEAFGKSDVGDLPPGTAVGPFMVRERLARGGMATVYAAERADGAYRQRVAIKVLRRGLDTDDLLRRFRTERQILSTLDHPNIARLLDGGSLPDGRPWLAVELVDGKPITTWADQRRLGIAARLELFLGVVAAVQAAHQRLIVHRDIKPSNILVDPRGRVKLLDFGIAKLLDADEAHTAVDTRPLTPAYATPEQLSGGAITTATDVYQLGLLLRELLTGCRPGTPPDPRHDAISTRTSRLAMQQLPDAADPGARARDRGLTPERLGRALRGDLDVVISKALRAEPAERYAGAGELAADIRRHLRGLPVLAHPESLGYRSRKFVARHRWSVLAGGLATAMLVGYTVMLNVQGHRLAAERDRAAREAAKAKEVTNFLVDLFHDADPDETGGQPKSARDLLLEGAARLSRERVADPGLRAAMRSAIGRSLASLGDYRGAEDQLRLAVAAHRDAGVVDARDLVATLDRLGIVVLSHDAEAALLVFEDARVTARDLLGPEDPAHANLLVDYSVALASAHPGDPRVDAMLDTAVATLRAAPGDVREELANALTVRGRGRPAREAIPRMREALELRRSIHPEVHTTVATSLSDLALATEEVDPGAADTLLTRSVAILRQLHPRGSPILLAAMNNLAGVRRDRGAYAEAEPLYREVLALRGEFYPELRTQLAYTLYGLGLVLTETGRAAEGERHLREALAILEQERPGSILILVTRGAIGHALAEQRRFAAAESLLVDTWSAADSAGLAAEQRRTILTHLVGLYRLAARPAEAARYQAVLDTLAVPG